MKRVLVFGGTHGNEWTGIAAVTNHADALKKKYPALDLHFIQAYKKDGRSVEGVGWSREVEEGR